MCNGEPEMCNGEPEIAMVSIYIWYIYSDQPE